MPAKRGTSGTGKSGKARPDPEPSTEAEAPAEPAPAEPVPAVEPVAPEPVAAAAEAPDAAGEEQDPDAPPEPANRAERRALARGKGGPPPAGKLKQFGRGAPTAHAPRHWQGRRGG